MFGTSFSHAQTARKVIKKCGVGGTEEITLRANVQAPFSQEKKKCRKFWGGRLVFIVWKRKPENLARKNPPKIGGPRFWGPGEAVGGGNPQDLGQKPIFFGFQIGGK